jgi:hypothetical protein
MTSLGGLGRRGSGHLAVGTQPLAALAARARAAPRTGHRLHPAGAGRALPVGRAGRLGPGRRVARRDDGAVPGLAERGGAGQPARGTGARGARDVARACPRPAAARRRARPRPAGRGSGRPRRARDRPVRARSSDRAGPAGERCARGPERTVDPARHHRGGVRPGAGRVAAPQAGAAAADRRPRCRGGRPAGGGRPARAPRSVLARRSGRRRLRVAGRAARRTGEVPVALGRLVPAAALAALSAGSRDDAGWPAVLTACSSAPAWLVACTAGSCCPGGDRRPPRRRHGRRWGLSAPADRLSAPPRSVERTSRAPHVHPVPAHPA